MRIYKMTATFGKLEQAQLTLEPGLNVITAPNEWGKSTWCAFLVAMLYGLDSRAKTTKNNLADKERYAPWSGSPMAGRIDLCWNGRNITIERGTRRRVPLGEFRAYETETGLPVEELTASNCGAMLLGVEQSVFRRAGFIRHTDLPVTQDEALRRRLNALVTTGDDSGAADRLASELKTLKNNCRYNRTGLLPQAETRRAEMEAALTEMESLEFQMEKLQNQLEDVNDGLARLRNHRLAMNYARMEADAALVAQARETMEQTRDQLAHLEQTCATLPDREETEGKLRQLHTFLTEWDALQQDLREAPSEPAKPHLILPFAGMSIEDARAMAIRDMRQYETFIKTKVPLLLVLIGIAGAVAAASLTVLKAYIFALIAGTAGAVALVWGILERTSNAKQATALLEKYGDPDHNRWLEPVDDYAWEMAEYTTDLKTYQQSSSDLEVRQMVLVKKRDELCGYQEPEVLLTHWQQALAHWENCAAARREALRAKEHYETLNAMLRNAEKPSMPDELSWTEAETQTLEEEHLAEQQRLLGRLGQYQGRLDSLGSRENLETRYQQLLQRIEKLEDTYAAVTIAQETLMEARAELQRRFAPRITRKAQSYLARMTGRRYHTLTMSEDFSLRAGAEREEVLHDALWRSDGTVDQLYLALRLAVAEELTPEAPLILDDALVRFDDERMSETVALLGELAEKKQIILFTCQGRESKI